MNAAVTRYRVMAYIVGVLLIVLVFVGIPLQVFAHQDAIANYVGTTHGILYMVYLVTAYMLARRLRMTLGQTLIVLLAGIIPIMTFVVERWVTRRFLTPGEAGRRGGRHRDDRGSPGGLIAACPSTISPRRAPRPTARARCTSCCPTCTCASRRTAGCSRRAGSTRGPGCCSRPCPLRRLAGDLLDLGCGYGPIALTMAARSAAAVGPNAGSAAQSPGATVWAVDVNTRALELCERNAARARACATSARSRRTRVPAAVTFAAIWSNPPIRIGKLALHDLLARWLGRLAARRRGLSRRAAAPGRGFTAALAGRRGLGGHHGSGHGRPTVCCGYAGRQQPPRTRRPPGEARP